MAMNISNEGLNLIKRWEGLRLKSYRCSANVLTIGYGITGIINIDGKDVRITEGMTITKKQADESFLIKIKPYVDAVNKNIKVKITQGMFDAICSLVYNCGTNQKTLYNLINNYKFDEALDNLKSHNKARINGNLTVLKGLVNRRNDEAKLWKRNMYLKPLSEVLQKGNPLYIIWCQRKMNEFAKNNKIQNWTVLVVDGKYGQLTMKAVNIIREYLGYKTFKDKNNKITVKMINKIA